MDIEGIIRLVETIGFAGLIGGGSIYYILKTSAAREEKMWNTIDGFQKVLHKFDGTLKDVAHGLVEVTVKVDKVEKEVAELKEHRKEE